MPGRVTGTSVDLSAKDLPADAGPDASAPPDPDTPGSGQGPGKRSEAQLDAALAKARLPQIQRQKTAGNAAPSLKDILEGRAKLKPGQEGEAVKHIQKLLNVKPTGVYGPTTQAAVRKFQSAHQLHHGEDQVGQATLQAMEADHYLFNAGKDLHVDDDQRAGLAGDDSFDPARIRTIPTDSAIVNQAQRYLNTPYVWGQKDISQGGIDCSGFVDQVYKNCHIKLPPGWSNDTSKDPSNDPSICDNQYMHHVDPSQAKPGDVVIFGNKHIGIYAGDIKDNEGHLHKIYVGANHGSQGPNNGRVDFSRVDVYPDVTPQFYHPTRKALEEGAGNG